MTTNIPFCLFMESAEPNVLPPADTDKTGSPETIIYFTHDANMNLTAALEADGDILERCEYTASGQVSIVNGGTARTTMPNNS